MTARKLDVPMTNMSVEILEDHEELGYIIQELVHQKRLQDALYVMAILRTDLIEVGNSVTIKGWPRPGQASPQGWKVYQAALRWCRGPFQSS
jgi:hypothetical protein